MNLSAGETFPTDMKINSKRLLLSLDENERFPMRCTTVDLSTRYTGSLAERIIVAKERVATRHF